MKRIVLSFLALLLLAASSPIIAQDQSAAINVVASAVNALRELDSFRIHTHQIIVQNMEFTTTQQSATTTTTTTTFVTLDITQTSDFQVVKTNEGYDVIGTVERNTFSDTAVEPINLALTFEVVGVGDKMYVRTTGEAGPLSAILPEGWVDLDDPSLIGNPIFASFNSAIIQQLYHQNIPIDEHSVILIEELNGEEMDGQSMRIFQ
jgi:hypothetical protein